MGDSHISSLHHFACSGGTIISKCVAAMPNVLLLSELDPLSPLSPLQKKFENPEFSPSDPIRLLKHNIKNVGDETLIKMFQESLFVLNEFCISEGLRLVIRDHTHSHYCVGEGVNKRVSMRNILSEKFTLSSAITVRDPVQAYLSLIKVNWIHFSPGNFNEYCLRLNTFINDNLDLDIIKYEEFSKDPDCYMKLICEQIQVDYDPDFHKYISAIKLTGDSGRSSDEIKERSPKAIPSDIKEEIMSSMEYEKICQKLSYARI